MQRNTERYSVKIIDSTVELSAKDKAKLVTGLDDCVSINDTIDDTADDALVIENPLGYVELEITNPKAENPVYSKYIIVTKDGEWYITGSESLIESYLDIAEIMSEVDEDYSIKIKKVESRNYKGKHFFKCYIL